ncbi:MAG TPA: PA14 domain-containing protein, partial [Candidatus Thermoplasmatota archaeon]|nr:PA14 domain-containing protein [Candidatus Thermoplasmatota archaeon]
TALTGSLSVTTANWHIGDNGNNAMFFKGVVDEVQIANTCFSAGWIKTFYNNLNTPSKFHLLSIEENQSGFPPVISHEKPVHTSVNNQFNPTLEVTVTDLNNDNVYCEFWTNKSGSWHKVRNTTIYNGFGIISDATENITTPNTKYWWSVNATDLYGSRKWTNKTYWFVTGVGYPIISEVYPDDQDALYNPVLSVKIQDTSSNYLTVIFRKKIMDVWETINTYHGYSGVYTQTTQNMDVKDQTYYWSINVSYGSSWINRSYSFTAYAFIQKWYSNTYCRQTLGPLSADVNHDGIHEIFLTGDRKAICVNGLNGNLIWEYSHNLIMDHSPFELADLNNDGIEEIVISCNRTGPFGATIALHADDGSVYWISEGPSDGKHPVIADVDGNGYPYVYVASDAYGGSRLCKLRGTDGAIVKAVSIYYPCYGGLSAADIENDGNIEILLADYNGEPGKGIHCYDKDLNLIWYQRARGDPQLPILVDVNNDGVLDSVTTAYSNGPVQVINGKTAQYIVNSGGYPNHSPNSVYDIDGDGHLEILIASSSPCVVFDLTTKTVDATLITCKEAPYMANVIGDDKLEILATWWDKLTIYNSTYQIVDTIDLPLQRCTLVQDIDNDGQNELVFVSENHLVAYETTVSAPTPRVRSVNAGYSERRTGAAVYIPPPGAPQPILKEASPNGSLDVKLNPTLSVHAIDFHYDRMNIIVCTNASGSWVTLASYTNVGNGWYNVTPTMMNKLDTTYYWRVIAVDPLADNLITNKTYHFKTKSAPKIKSVNISSQTPFEGQDVNISARITEDVHMAETKLRLNYPNGSYVNKSLYRYQWTKLTYDNFENNKWGNYTAGGANCGLYLGDWRLVHQGSYVANIEANSGVASSFNLTHPIDIATPSYNAIKIDFWMNAYGMGDGGRYYLEYYDGTQWQVRKIYEQNTGLFTPAIYTNTYYKFANWLFFHDTVWINKSTYNLPSNLNIRFRCASGGTGSDVYLDQIYINATRLEPTLYTSIESYTLPGQYSYSIWCKDINGNTNTSATSQFTVLVDTGLPQIANILVTPSTAIQGIPVNITCNVQDNVGVQDVRINISDPNANIVNYSIITNKINPNTYYYNQKYFTVGTYHFFIWATDPYNNVAKSQTISFVITKSPPLLSNVTPSNQSTNIHLNPTLSVSITDYSHDAVEWWISTNATGTWIPLAHSTLGNGNGVITAITTTMQDYSTRYYWRVNTREGTLWTNKTYSFTTEPINTSIASISPYAIISPTKTLTASGSPTLDNVTLWYRYSPDNITWEGSSINWWNTAYHYRTKINFTEPQGIARTKTHVLITITLPLGRLSNENDAALVDNGIQIPFDGYALTTQNGWVTTLQGLAEINMSAYQTKSCYLYYDPVNAATEKLPTTTGWSYIGATSYSGTNYVDLVPADTDCNGDSPTGEFTDVCGAVDYIKLNEWSYFKAPQTGTLYFKTGSDDGSGLWLNDSLIVSDNNGGHGVQWRDSTPQSLNSGRYYALEIDWAENDGGQELRNRWNTAPGDDSTGSIIDTEGYTFYGDEWQITTTLSSEEHNQGTSNKFNTDTIAPWQWEFNFPNSTGYYQFFSLGRKTGIANEVEPQYADAICFYNYTGNRTPVLQSPTPPDNSNNVPVGLSTLTVQMSDPENDFFNWTIHTSPNIGSASENHVNNGMKTCPISTLNLGATYTWYVNATDLGSHRWTNKTYTFTVQDDAPTVTLNSPTNGATISSSQITLNCTSTDDVNLHNVTLYFGSTDLANGNVNVRVSTGTDDAEEYLSTHAIDLVSTDLELIQDPNQGNQEVGMRFQNVAIPPGATITNAYIEFEVDELNSDTTNLNIYGQAIDNAPTFTSTASDITSRIKTSSFAAWNNVPSWDTESQKKHTPDASTVIQEIINRPGWSSGNSMVIIITGTGHRTAEAYEGESANAPLLVVNYTTGGIPVWHADQVKTISGITNTTTFIVNLNPGSYKWNCRAYDAGGHNAFAPSNYTFTVLPPQYTLAMNTIGSGSVTKNPNQSTYNSGTIVTLTATPASGWSFTGWSGDLTGSTNPTTITMTGNKAVTATFTINPTTAGWSAYNDLAGAASSAPATNYHSGNSGLLKDYATGTNTAVSVSISGGTNDGTGPGVLPSGTDAYKIFNGKINPDSILHYSGGNHIITFTGLDSSKRYRFVHWADRADSSNPYNSTVTITDVTSFTKNSSTAVTHSQTTLPYDTASYYTGYNSVHGYVAGFTNIDPGTDGDMTITVSGATKWYSGAFMLQELLPIQVNFTIIALPDTQNYASGYPTIFTNQTQWIVAHKNALNIVWVTNEGDITNGGSDLEFQRADAAYDLLEDPATTQLPYGIPYTIIQGNHDHATNLFNTYFNYTRFAGRTYYGGHYPTTKNDNNYALFSAGGMDFIAIGLDYAADTNELAWAENLTQTYSTRRAIVVSHSILNNAAGDWTGEGINIYNALKDNSNLFLMLCGHMHYEGRRADTYNGNVINTLLADYQDYPNGGNGWLRIMTFCPATNEIKVKTYSPYLDQYQTDADSQFTLSYTMNPSPALYTLTVNTVGSGLVAKTPDQSTYSLGTVVTLTATPAQGYSFTGWSGDLTGSINPTTITMNGNKTVTATFTALPPSQGGILETFNTGFTTGQTVGAHADWYDGGSGPVITAGNGVGGSIGLAPSGTIFTWEAHPFNWNDPDFIGVNLRMDFESSSTGKFDDDRIGWATSVTGTGSEIQFGVQLDDTDGGIVTFWRNSADARVQQPITTYSGITSNTYYRLRANITKLTATAAKIDVSLTKLDGSGNEIGVVASGSVANTSSYGSNAPATRYFTVTSMWPTFKSYSTEPGDADNAYYELIQPQSWLRIYNPYEDVNFNTANSYKGNFHTHTTYSDGSSTPDAVIDYYHDIGHYDILALTDHSHNTWPWSTWITEEPVTPSNTSEYYPTLNMLAISANEPSNSHNIGSYLNDYAGGDLDAAFQYIQNHHGLSIFMHPGRYSYAPSWYNTYFNTYDDTILGVEAYNQGDRYPGDRVKWDSINKERDPDNLIWGFSDDDMHSLAGNAFRNYQHFFMNNLNESDFRNAMINGAFFFSYEPDGTNQADPNYGHAKTPKLTNVIISGSVIQIAGTDYTSIQWYNETTAVVGTGTSINVSNLNSNFVRAVLINTYGSTCTQPFGYEETTTPPPTYTV